MRVCIHCESQLYPKDKNLICVRCTSAFVDLAFLKAYLREYDFEKLERDLINSKSKSSHNCVQCKKQMSLHLIGKDIMVEACSPCRKIWFEAGEIQKFQTYTQLRNDGKNLTFEPDDSLVPFSRYLFHRDDDSNFFPQARLGAIASVARYEAASNLIGNKIADTKFFKKYPILTFCIVVAVIVGFYYVKRRLR